ncbi:hypothetical protein B484DRAFT_409171, partial [Ochromonadaceae sp. CCMP2298]
FKQFKEIFPSFVKTKLDPLVAWTQIRSFIKGSVGALLGEGEGVGGSSGGDGSGSGNSGNSSSGSRALSLSAYLALAKGRCRLQPAEREEAYKVYVQYEAHLRSKGLWDDCDRVMRILRTGLGMLSSNGGWAGGWGNGGAGMRYDRLFLAGDPAQFIVEGVDFRFEEVRGIVYALSQQTVNISSPVTLNTNYRSHAGILDCASGVLDLLLSTFPNAADKLPPDLGLCRGPRPEYLSDTGAAAGTGAVAGAGSGAFLQRWLKRNPRVVVLCRDEQFQEEGNLGGQEEKLQPDLRRFVPELTLVLGIRASKGMEFSDVLLLNFFCDLTKEDT